MLFGKLDVLGALRLRALAKLADGSPSVGSKWFDSYSLSHKKGGPLDRLFYGSPSWIRTSDRPINSRMLYR